MSLDGYSDYLKIFIVCRIVFINSGVWPRAYRTKVLFITWYTNCFMLRITMWWITLHILSTVFHWICRWNYVGDRAVCCAIGTSKSYPFIINNSTNWGLYTRAKPAANATVKLITWLPLPPPPQPQARAPTDRLAWRPKFDLLDHNIHRTAWRHWRCVISTYCSL